MDTEIRSKNKRIKNQNFTYKPQQEKIEDENSLLMHMISIIHQKPLYVHLAISLNFSVLRRRKNG